MSTDIQLKRQRLEAIRDFERARTKTYWQLAWFKLTRRSDQLLSFSAIERYLPRQQPFNRGIQEIPVANIVGSVGRCHEFNRAFFPLRDSLSERWVNSLILARTLGWPPVRVYKVGNLYFVEDGHHRVSVAHWIKNIVIEAEVHEYPLDQTFEPTAAIETIIAQIQQQRPRPTGAMASSHAMCL